MLSIFVRELVTVLGEENEKRRIQLSFTVALARQTDSWSLHSTALPFRIKQQGHKKRQHTSSCTNVALSEDYCCRKSVSR